MQTENQHLGLECRAVNSEAADPLFSDLRLICSCETIFLMVII